MVVPSVKQEEVAGLFPKGVKVHQVPSGKVKHRIALMLYISLAATPLEASSVTLNVFLYLKYVYDALNSLCKIEKSKKKIDFL